MTPEEHLALGKIHPELEQLLASGKVAYSNFHPDTNLPNLRKVLSDRKREFVAARTGDQDTVTYIEEDIQIPVRDGTTITVRIHKPRNPPKDGSPIFVMLHGGGFCIGGLDNETLLLRRWTELGGIAVNVDYRLAPEHQFPVGTYDAYDALKWTAANFERLGGNHQKGFFLGGISAGAAFSATLALLYYEDKNPLPLTGLYLSILPCISPDVLPELDPKYHHLYLSREQNAGAPSLNASGIELFEKNYNSDPTSKLYTPLRFSSHKHLPPTYFQVTGLDPLRDEALIYERILREDNGVTTKLDIYPGLPHSFWSWAPEAEFSQSFEDDCVEGMKWLLAQSA